MILFKEKTVIYKTFLNKPNFIYNLVILSLNQKKSIFLIIIKRSRKKLGTSIKELLFYMTILIKTEMKDGKGSIGTGFLFWKEFDEKTGQLFLITNRHVVEKSIKGTLTFHKKDENGNPLKGETEAIEIDDFEKKWKFHPNGEIDIAIYNITQVISNMISEGKRLYYHHFSKNEIADQKLLEEDTDAIEDILFIGYPMGIYDVKNYLPIVREGITATPNYIDFNNKPIFLVDGSVFEGSSGSPVIILNTGGYNPRNGGLKMGSRFYLLGILSRTYYNSISFEKIEQLETSLTFGIYPKEKIDLGIVYKSKLILEMIN